MKAALYQARTGVDPKQNAVSLARAIALAAKGGAAMIFTPEMSGLLDRNAERASRSITAQDDDAVLRVVRSAAAEHRIWVQLGSLAVRLPDGRLANRALLIDDLGVVRTTYDKMHLFDVDLPGGESWRESARYLAGDEAVAADTPLGRLGLSICYDVRFPALYAALAAAGATLLSIPSAFTVPSGTAHWHVLCRARAIEAGAWVVATAQCGRHEDGRRTYGHSLVVDPWGEVLLDMGGAEDEVAFAEIDPVKVDLARAAIPTLQHRRTVGEAQVSA